MVDVRSGNEMEMAPQSFGEVVDRAADACRHRCGYRSGGYT